MVFLSTRVGGIRGASGGRQHGRRSLPAFAEVYRRLQFTSVTQYFRLYTVAQIGESLIKINLAVILLEGFDQAPGENRIRIGS